MRRHFILVVAMSFLIMGGGRAIAGDRGAREIIEEYLRLPCSDTQRCGEGRAERVRVLYQLKDIPDQAVPEIARVLPDIDNRVHRLELIEILGRIGTRESADVLIPLLKHPDPEVRGQVVWSLRLHAMCTSRSGPLRQPRGPDFPPKVEGLVPYLVAAAGDENEGVRRQATYALADTRDPAAHTKLRELLNDSDGVVRFLSACFLTEFDDPAGQPELRQAVDRLRTEPRSVNPAYYMDAQRLFASLERITGESMGSIPPDPMVLSVYPPPSDIDQRFQKLLDAWAEYLAARAGEEQ